MKPPIVSARMLIRKPVEMVFDALIDPSITTKFWFTKSTGKIEPGAELVWEWEMYGVSTRVVVTDVEPNKRILIEWDDPLCPVEWIFESRGPDKTLVYVSNSGFSGTDDEVVAKAIDSMGGFTSLLADLKAYLEHGVRLHLVRDHNPDAHVDAAK